jgi:uncharacterized protein with beta-barrel porin domain
VEFFWADFMRNRVMWTDSAAVTSQNLINAPVSFFAAAANAIALGKSELYADQNGRSIFDYTGEGFSKNANTWANASILNGLAAPGDTYNLFLTDDSWIQGDLIASGVEGVVTNLNINTGSLMSISGALKNLDTIKINTGASITIDWKDAAVNAVAQNKVLTIAAGTGNVVFAGDNDYSKLSSLVIGAGELTIDTTYSSTSAEMRADISGSGSLRKKGWENLLLAGSNTFSGGVYLEEGQLTLGSTSVLSGGSLVASPVGLGALKMKEGSILAFDENVRLLNSIQGVSGTADNEGFGITFKVDYNSVELAGGVKSDVPVTIYGGDASVLTLSSPNLITGTLTVATLTLRVAHPEALSMDTIYLQSGATIQAGTSFVAKSNLVIDGRLDSGESLLEWAGVISGPGHLTITGYNGGAVRLSGLNTYTGGTEINDSRVEVGVNASDAETYGEDISGRAFGSGDIVLNSGVMAFAVSASIPNPITITGNSGFDVGSNVGLIAGGIGGDGSLYVTGTKEGALFLTGPSTYTGRTEVEGTTLRVLSSAGSEIFGDNSHPLSLNDATLQVVPDYFSDLTVASFGTRGLRLGEFGGTLDATDNNLRWHGIVSGPGKLTVKASLGNTVELTGTNTYLGGTEVTGGALLLIADDKNLGAQGGGVTLNNGGIAYTGSLGGTFSRSVEIRGFGLADVGSQSITQTGDVFGSGVFQVGRTSTTGSLYIGASAKGFVGTVAVGGGTLAVTHQDALKGSTLEVSASGGNVVFSTTQASLAGLSGDGKVVLPNGFKLTLGANGASSVFTGSLSSASATLSKVGLGSFTVAGGASGLAMSVDAGVLALGAGSTLDDNVKLSIAQGASLVVGGSHDLRNNFDLKTPGTVSAKSSILFNSAAGDVLTLPKAVYDAVSVIVNGQGRVDTVLDGVVSTVAADSVSKVSAGVVVGFDTSAGDVDLSAVLGRSKGGSADTVFYAPAGDNAIVYKAKPAVDGVLDAPLKVPVTADQVVLLPIRGVNPLTVDAGAKIKLVDSPLFSGTTSLGAGAAADITGSYGSLARPGLVNLSSGAVVSVNPTNAQTETVVPAFAGASDSSVLLNAGKITLSGSNAQFSGTVTIEKGVNVSVVGDLPKGTMMLKDPGTPLIVDTTANVLLPGKIQGDGALAISGSGKLTMVSGASLEVAVVKLGTSVNDRPVLDVTGLDNGLVLSSSQILSGGGTIVGSIKTTGTFAPGNSPGTFTVQKSSVLLPDGSYGGNLVLDTGSKTQIEFGKRSVDGVWVSDKVVVQGSLTLSSGARVAVAPYVGTDSAGVQYGAGALSSRSPLRLSGVFSANSITLGNFITDFASSSFLVTGTWVTSGSSLDFVITKAAYGPLGVSRSSQSLGTYLDGAVDTASSGLAKYLNALDSSADRAQLEVGLRSLSAPVYAEAQLISLRRTSAISAAVHGRISPWIYSSQDGWSAFSESYGWNFHRDSTPSFGSWNTNTFGEVAGVQKRVKGLALGVFGATGYSTASFSGPTSTLKGDSFHGGAYAQVTAGSLFLDASLLAGNVDQKVSRQVALPGLGGSANSAFSTSEYAAQLRAGVTVPTISGAYLCTPSFSLLCNGFSQDAVNETGLDGISIATAKKSLTSWQTRIGNDVSRAFKVGGSDGVLSASFHWIHDFDNNARATTATLSGAAAGAGTFRSFGSKVGAETFEFGISAGLEVSKRTTLRAGGNWQVREGASQPGVNVGVSVRF